VAISEGKGKQEAYSIPKKRRENHLQKQKTKKRSNDNCKLRAKPGCRWSVEIVSVAWGGGFVGCGAGGGPFGGGVGGNV